MTLYSDHTLTHVMPIQMDKRKKKDDKQLQQHCQEKLQWYHHHV